MTPAASSLPHRTSARNGAGGASASRDSIRLAAIDVGSNSIHMIVAQADADSSISTLWRMKEPLGLGRASFPSRRLSREAMSRAIAVLARFRQSARQRQVEKIVAVATSAVREATNGGDFIERVRRRLGLVVRVVSPREEARLIYLAVRHALPLRTAPRDLIVDIGGGSVEFIVGDARHAHLLDSRKLGAARMTASFIRSDPISDGDRAALAAHYDKELTPLCEQILALKPARMIGTSGTIESLAAMCGTHGGNGARGQSPHRRDDPGAIGFIDRSTFEPLLEKLIKSRASDREGMRGLDAQRQDQIVAGAMLTHELFRRLKFRRITLCGCALREGILLDYLARHIPDLQIRREIPDPRRRSVIDLARRCAWHRGHSEQVALLATTLFDELRSLHRMGPPERELIEYGALLHDIGWHIARKGHHKHSAYLIVNGALKNFSDEEVLVVANIARYHRKSVPQKKHADYARLSARSRRIVDAGAALLRIADGLDRSHSSVVTALHCRFDAKCVRCTLTARSDAELEIWGARRKRSWFEDVFGRDLVFDLAAKK